MPLTYLEVDLTGRSDALARLVLLLGRRRCEIVSLQYSCAGGGRAHLLLELRVPPRRPVIAWLGGLIDVLAVREREAEAAASSDAAGPTRPSAGARTD